VAEGALRFQGRTPGYLWNNSSWRQVDSLYMLKGFVSDENGIFKVDTQVAAKMAAVFNDEVYQSKKIVHLLDGKKWDYEVPSIYKDHLQLLNYNLGQNPFGKRLKRALDVIHKTPFDSILIHYAQHPINADGFYSIPFDSYCEGKKKVLLLGDSFTWGHSAQSKTASFANTLLSKGYLVCNTGISGADVAQYKQVVKTYFDSINPDVVILNFYMGNDVAYFERKLSAGIPIHYNTNAGNLVAFRQGLQRTGMQKTYDSIIRDMLIPKTTWINRLTSETAMGTMIWQVLVRFNVIDHQFVIYPEQPETPYCNKEIASIREFCEASNVPFVLSVIPNIKDGKINGAKTVKRLFEGIKFVTPNVSIDHYKNVTDGHFNDLGHLFYANYLESLINKELAIE